MTGKAIVIVMLTTSLHPVDPARAQELPIAGFLNKPLTKEKVTAGLCELLLKEGQRNPESSDLVAF